MFIQFYYLLPRPVHFETSEGVQNQTRLTNTIYKFFFFFLSSFASRFSSLYKRHTTYTNL